jgi:hypothetical protein
MGWYRNTRERINIVLFNIRDKVFRVVNILSVVATVVGLIIIIRFLGFAQDEETSLALTNYLQRHRTKKHLWR